jgi:hypothetical protein
MLFQRPKIIPASVEIYKAFKDLTDRHRDIRLINNDGEIELHDQRFPYSPIIMIGKGAVFYDPKDSKNSARNPEKQNPLKRTMPIQTLSLFLSFSSRNRPPSHIHLWDGWGEGLAHGAWSAVAATSGVLELAPGPVASLPHMEPSRCPAGGSSADTSVAGGSSATHVGGRRRALTGRMPGEVQQPCSLLEGPPRE